MHRSGNSQRASTTSNERAWLPHSRSVRVTVVVSQGVAMASRGVASTPRARDKVFPCLRHGRIRGAVNLLHFMGMYVRGRRGHNCKGRGKRRDRRTVEGNKDGSSSSAVQVRVSGQSRSTETLSSGTGASECKPGTVPCLPRILHPLLPCSIPDLYWMSPSTRIPVLISQTCGKTSWPMT